VSEAWFGLLGVVIGGLISTLWSWLSVVRQELSDGMVAARLVDEELRGVDLSVGGVRPGDALSADTWREHRVALAKVLGEPQWNAVADVYRLSAGSGSAQQDVSASTIDEARAALSPLVQGKRYVIPQRWRSMLAALRRKPSPPR
jgi:hypothetical protein